MCSAFYQLCLRYNGTLTPTVPTAIKLWESFTFFCSMADGISFDVSLSLNCTDLYKRGGGA